MNSDWFNVDYPIGPTTMALPRRLDDLLDIPAAAALPSCFARGYPIRRNASPHPSRLSIIGIDSPSKSAYANSLRFERKQIRIGPGYGQVISLFGYYFVMAERFWPSSQTSVKRILIDPEIVLLLLFLSSSSSLFLYWKYFLLVVSHC